MMSHELIACRRIQMRPRGCSASSSSAEGPKPIGVERALANTSLTSSYSTTKRR
jgi:hypothetical protein